MTHPTDEREAVCAYCGRSDGRAMMLATDAGYTCWPSCDAISPPSTGRRDDYVSAQMSAQDEADAERIAGILAEDYGIVYVGRLPLAMQDDDAGWCVFYGCRNRAATPPTASAPPCECAPSNSSYPEPNADGSCPLCGKRSRKASATPREEGRKLLRRVKDWDRTAQVLPLPLIDDINAYLRGDQPAALTPPDPAGAAGEETQRSSDAGKAAALYAAEYHRLRARLAKSEQQVKILEEELFNIHNGDM